MSYCTHWFPLSVHHWLCQSTTVYQVRRTCFFLCWSTYVHGTNFQKISDLSPTPQL